MTHSKKVGRPLKEIDWQKVITLCQIFCTEVEIASVLDCNIDTLYEACKREHSCNFPEFFKKHSENGRASLRRAQYKKALEGNPTMLIWMGKQALGQRDQVETHAVEPIKLGYDPSKLPDEK